MNKAGDFLSAIFDANTLDKAKKSSRLLSAWEELAKKYGIVTAAYHSQIQDIQRGILYISADHPGWVQLLQTKEQFLLADISRMFPELGITGIAFKLGSTYPDATAVKETFVDNTAEKSSTDEISPDYVRPGTSSAAEKLSGYEKIKDKTLVDNLKSLEETLKKRRKKKK